jgi:hypothetical protein
VVAPVIPTTHDAEIGESQYRLAWAKSVRLYLKNKLSKKEWGVTPVVDLLLSKPKVLS